MLIKYNSSPISRSTYFSALILWGISLEWKNCTHLMIWRNTVCLFIVIWKGSWTAAAFCVNRSLQQHHVCQRRSIFLFPSKPISMKLHIKPFNRSTKWQLLNTSQGNFCQATRKTKDMFSGSLASTSEFHCLECIKTPRKQVAGGFPSWAVNRQGKCPSTALFPCARVFNVPRKD